MKRIVSLLIGVLAFGVIVALIVPRVTNREGDGPNPVRADIATYETCLRQFHVDTGRYPTTSEGLAALLTAPPNLKSWRGPYMSSLPVDPWGRRYIYSSDHGLFSITTLGRDGVPGGEDQDQDTSSSE